MRSLFIILAAKALDLDAGFGDRGEGPHVQALVTQRPVEALAKAVLPRVAWIDVECRCVAQREPALNRLGDELRAVVAAKVGRRSVRSSAQMRR
jgi:hypothetical protein